MSRLHFLKESTVATCLIVVATFLIIKIPISNELRKGLLQGVADFDVYDLHYTGKSGQPKVPDTNIVIVEVGNTRSEIARQIDMISNYNPRIIGVDVLFEEKLDPLEDQALAGALQERSNVVLATRFLDTPDPHLRPNHFDPDCRQSGYANFIGNRYSVNRTYAPSMTIDGEQYLSFSSAIMKKAWPERYESFCSRGNAQELIHYRGNVENFVSISAADLSYYHSTGQLNALIRDKIVLLGFFVKQDNGQSQPLVLDDLHFSPLNETVFGKSFPDMYGVVVHANILSMILDNEYAMLAPKKISFLFAFLLTLLFSGFILYCYSRSSHPGHGWLMLVQFAVILVVIYLFLVLFEEFKYKVPLQPIIISLVLSLEMFGLYKLLAGWLSKKFHYHTVFTHNHSI